MNANIGADLVHWHDRFSNGIPEVDEQHRSLFELVNRAYRAVVERAGSAEVQEIVKALEQYTLRHFADEERYMMHARYPKFGEHKKIHDEFVGRVAVERSKLQAGFPLDVGIVHFLRDWLIDHILKMDMDFGHFERRATTGVRSARTGFFKRMLGGGLLGSFFGGAAPARTTPEVATAVRVPIKTARNGLVDLQATIEFHMRWKIQLEAVVAGASTEHIDPEVARRDDRCALGLWLHGEGRQRFELLPEYADVMMWHAEFHRQAASIVEAALTGDRASAVQRLARGEYATAAVRLRGSLSKMFAAAQSSDMPAGRSAKNSS